MMQTRETGIKFNFTRRHLMEIALLVGSFFAARVVVFGGSSPFSIIYIAPLLFTGKRFYAAAFLSIFGLFTNFSTQYSMLYLITIVLMCVANLLMSLRPKTVYETATLTQALTAGASFLAAGFALVFLREQGFFHMAVTILEAGIIFALTVGISRAINRLMQGNKGGVLNNHETISALLMWSVIMVGMADIYVWQLSLRYITAFLIVILAAKSGGATMGAVGGMLLGFFLNITGFEYIFFAVLLGISGFAGGLAHQHGKIPVLLAFSATLILAILYFDLTLFSMETFGSLIVTVIIFMALPKRFLSNISISYSPSPPAQYMERIRGQVLERVNNIAGGYKKLAKIFESRVENKGVQANAIDKLVKSAQEATCAHCSRLNFCWQDKHEESWKFMDEIVPKAQRRGKLHTEDAPKEFYKQCINASDFMAHLGAALERDLLVKEWQQKVVEAKSTIYHQFSGLSEVMQEFALELSTILNFKKELEDKILYELEKEGMEMENVVVIENTLGKYEIDLSRKGRMQDYSLCLGIISRISGRQMELVEERYNGGVVHLNYLEKEKFYIHSGVAKVNKAYAAQSGDSFSLIQLGDGRLICALSDGMGSGERAKEGSEAAIELLEELMEKGFKKDIAIKLINSALLLKSNDEFFSTLDICVIDLNSGLAEFMKIGASASYLLRDGRVEAIGSWTLPVGILETVEIDSCQRYITHGDMVVMVTDGVADTVKNSEETWLHRLLEKKPTKNPQDLADHILEEAKRNCGHNIKDDMTVLVLRVIKN